MHSRHILIILSLIAAVAALALVVSAGNPDNPPGPPETTSSYRLEDIYRRLSTGAAGTQITFTEPISGPMVGTGHTLDQIMAVAPQLDDTNGAATSQVVSGSTYWGLQSGAWGLQTGTAAAGSNVTGGDGQSTFAIPDGYYAGSRTATAQDADLVAGNIRSGANLFGVAGNPNVVNTASGDAAAGDIRGGRVAWVDGIELTGTGTAGNNVTGGDGQLTFAIPDGFYTGSKTATAQDADLAAGNIRAGASIFGVDGTLYAPVPKTGQTTPQATGDDGDLEMGVAWPSTRFLRHRTGVVTDMLTGLVWLENADCFGQKNWATALSDANGLASGYCDLTDGSSAGDWRLPNVRELQSLIDYGQYGPALPDGHPFLGVQLSSYWSSSTHAYNTSGWYVHLFYGYVSNANKTIDLYVWPVRGGQ